MPIDKLYILQLRDVAIEYLPRAQKTREQARKFALTREQYYRRLFYDAIMIRGAPTAAAVEIAAAGVLYGVLAWIDCDPQSPELQADLQLNASEIESLMMWSIAQHTQYLEKVTGRELGIELPSHGITPEPIDNGLSSQGIPKRKIMSAFQGLKWGYDYLKERGMKNAKDYIKESGTEDRIIITSLAYWLTPDGLQGPLIACLIREIILDSTDDEFEEAFDGATKNEAAQYVDQWELCYMTHWGAPELVKAIVSCDATRSGTLSLRAINLAQSAKELPEIFSPKIGIQWAMARGYLINENISIWCGIDTGIYGHPNNPLSTANKPAVKDKVTLYETPGDNWKSNARQIGERIYKEKRNLNVEQIAKKTHSEMTQRKKNGEKGMTGRGDRIPSPGNIKRHALTGLKTLDQ